MENIAAIAEAAVLVTDLGQFADLNAVYGTYFPDKAPASACYEVPALPKGAKVEIEAVVL